GLLLCGWFGFPSAESSVASVPSPGARKRQVGGLASLRAPRAGFACRQEANRSPAQEAVLQARKYRETPPRKSERPARPRKQRTRAASPPRRQPSPTGTAAAAMLQP